MISREVRPITGERVINTYDFTDVLTGNSYVAFYAGKTASSSIMRSHTFETESTDTQYTVSDTYTVDFDAEVENAQIVQGQAVVSMRYGETTATASTIVPTAILIRVRGGEETEIGRIELPSDSSSGTRHTEIMECKRTSLKNGDKLRLRISSVVTIVAGGTVLFWHQPEDTTNMLKTYIPFRIRE